MYNRRQGRAITSSPAYSTMNSSRFQQKPPLQQQYQQQQQQIQQKQQQQAIQKQQEHEQQLQLQQQEQQQQQQQKLAEEKKYQTQQPVPQNITPASNIPAAKEEPTSPTTKAVFSRVEIDAEGKKKWKKGLRLPLAIRRKKMNKRLSKILTPKSALILLHELKPGCLYTVTEQPNTCPTLFVAVVEHEGRQLGTGQGASKSLAKNSAAENAIKGIVSQVMVKKSESQTSIPEETKMEVDGEKEDDPTLTLPWAGLASLAIYKMFSEWQNQGTDIPLSTTGVLKKKKVTNKPAVKKELPPNPTSIYPTVLLNMMQSFIPAVELSRTPPPNSSITVGYEIEGVMYTGVASNRKKARNEAAKAALKALYDLTYPD